MIDTTVIWNSAKSFWHDDKLPDPKLYWSAEDGDKILKGEIAGFEYKGRQTHVHMKNLEQRLGLEFLEPVEKHEIGHDKFCPYDLKTCFSLIAAADEIQLDLKKAKEDENLFADILVNTHTINKGDDSIVHAYQKMEQSPNKLWNFYMRTCEIIWEKPKGMLSHFSSPEMDQDAEQMSETAKKVMYDSKDWVNAQKEFSQITKKYREEEASKSSQDQNSTSKNQDGGNENPSSLPGNNQEISKKPFIGQHSPKNFVPYKVSKKDIQSQKQLAQDLKDISKHIPYKQFKRVATGTGICDLPLAAKMYYLDVASRYEIDPPSAIGRGGSVIPFFRKEWLPEDTPEKLDVQYGLEQMGRIIPGRNTYKFHMEKGRSGDLNRIYKDLLIVQDSSQSMPDPSKMFSVPVLSSIIVAHSAINKGQQVGVVNFSTDYLIVDYTGNRYEVDDGILHYFKGNTWVPGQQVLDQVESNKNPQHILLITDTDIHNLESEISNLEQAIRRAGSGSIFLFGNASGKTSQLEDIGYNVHNSTTMEDLISLSKTLSEELYR